MTTATAPVLDTERAELLAELATTREALRTTVCGLSDAQLGERPTVSALCLGGLVKHVAATEKAWMQFVLHGASAMNFDLPEGVTWEEFMNGTAREYPQWAIDRQNDFQMQPGDTLAGILENYAAIAAETERVIAAVPDMSAARQLPYAPWNEEENPMRSVRRVLVHVIAETAQHAGHADILRETLDGQTTT
ncbi:DinB family protein [Nocardia takedensis]|uniref:DinB family protein n=1 Tax=Nocardia takedensis TaxID=259390 RepID=UPI0002F7407F|nr:DinB family protein [Nocardia takedensis]